MQIQPNGNVINTPIANLPSAVKDSPPVSAGNKSTEVAQAYSQNQTEPKTPLSKEEVSNATEKLQKFVETVRSDIQFSVDAESGRNVVKVVDKQTKDVLMQFPSEEALAISKTLDKFQGLFIKQQA